MKEYINVVDPDPALDPEPPSKMILLLNLSKGFSYIWVHYQLYRRYPLHWNPTLFGPLVIGIWTSLIMFWGCSGYKGPWPKKIRHFWSNCIKSKSFIRFIKNDTLGSDCTSFTWASKHIWWYSDGWNIQICKCIFVQLSLRVVKL